MQRKPISISLSPNTERDDIQLASRILVSPRLWKEGESQGLLEERVRSYHNSDTAVSFNSGRAALYAILRSLGVGPEDEVLLQAFTCNALVNPILWTGATPVYVDCEEGGYNMDVTDLEHKKTPKSKVVIVQHTFGEAGDLHSIVDFCKRHNLFLIEDCAHALGATYGGQLVGTFGDASFLSFGRDKVISCVYGGMAISHRKELSQKLQDVHRQSPMPSSFWIVQQLIHPIVMHGMILPIYAVGGKYLLEIAKRVHILSKAVSSEEKQGRRPRIFPGKLPNALASLALFQWEKMERYNTHRKHIADIYARTLRDSKFILPISREGRSHVFLRFPVRHLSAHAFLKRARKKNILLGDWYDTPIAPQDTNLEAMHYLEGSCPRAESLGKEILNLPTHIGISEHEAEQICSLLIQLDQDISHVS